MSISLQACYICIESRLLIAFLNIVAVDSLSAQQLVGKVPINRPTLPRVHSLTVQDGLTQSHITSIAQDKQGFMWFATPDGFNRFDGYEIVPFHNDPNDSLSPVDNYVSVLLTDRRGELWIGMKSVLGKLDRRTNRLAYFACPGPAHRARVSSLCEDSSGNIWVAFLGNGVARLDPVSEAFRTVRNDPNDHHSIGSNVIFAVAFDRHGRLWIGSDRGIDVIDPNSLRVFSRYALERIVATHLKAYHISVLFRDRSGVMWVGTAGGGMYRFDEVTTAFIPYREGSEDLRTMVGRDVRCILEDSEGRILAGMFGHGLNVLDVRAGVFTSLIAERSDEEIPIGIAVTSLHEDRSQNLWVGTEGGVRWFDLKRQKFSIVLDTKREHQMFKRELPLGMMGDERGKLWLSMHRLGVFSIDPREGAVRHIADAGGQSNTVKHIQAMLKDGNDALWFCTSGLEKRNADGKLIRRYENDSNDSRTIASDDAQAGCFDHEGYLWLGFTKGEVDKFDPRTEQFHHVQIDSLQSDRILGSKYVSAIVEDRDNHIWVGRADGLFRVTRKSEIVKTFRSIPADAHSLANNTILSLATSPKGTLWIGTARGLHRYDPGREEFIRYTVADGLPNDKIWAMLVDDSERAWVGTNRGLSRITPHSDTTVTMRNYGLADGLPSLEFIRGAACKNSSGRFFFATIGGIFSFHPDSIVENKFVPPVMLTGFKKFDQPFDLGENPSAIQQITLPYTDNVFSLRFAALEFTEPSRNTYAYIMEGFEPTWTYSGLRREVRYTHLDPGEYTFRVKASNNDGIWNDRGTAVKLTILPPFWRTWWFVLACVAATVAIFFLIMRYRISRALEIERTRTRIAADLHDELGSTLSAIALSSETLKDNPKLDEAERQRAATISDYARRTSDAMREIVWFVKPEHDSADQLLLKMRDVANAILSEVELAFSAETEALNGMHDLEQRRNIFLIYKETLTNIAKHAQCSRVQILLKRDDGLLTLRIEDNGIGFDVAGAHGRGNGLSNLRQRAEKIGGTLIIKSEIGKGSIVELVVRAA